MASRVAAGIYRDANGYEMRAVTDPDNAGIGRGWHLIDPTGEWCNTFATLRDAKAAAARIQATVTRHGGDNPKEQR